MRLITAHRVLIVAGIAFFLFYAMITLTRDHTAAGFLQVVVGLVFYDRTLRRWGS